MKTKNLFILLISLVVVMIGYGIAMPVLPFFLESLGGRGIHYGLLIASYGVMQLFFAPIWGSLSDKIGRKPLLLLGLTGMGIAMVIIALATELWMLYGAQILNGILSSATLPAAQAYAGDFSTPEQRGGAMGKVGGAIGLGLILGPGLGGFLAAQTISTPFFVAAGFCLVTFFMVLLVLPESLSREERTKTIEVRFLQVTGLWKSLFSPIGFGLSMAFVAIFGQTIFSGIYGLYALNRFGSGPEEVGAIMMGMAFMYALAQGIIVGPLTRRFGEKKVIIFGLLGNAFGFMLILLAQSFISALLAMSFFILLNALLKPAALAEISKKTSVKQGRAMGMAEASMSLGRIFGPLWAGAVFDFNMFLPFISGIILFVVLFGVSFQKGVKDGVVFQPSLSGEEG